MYWGKKIVNHIKKPQPTFWALILFEFLVRKGKRNNIIKINNTQHTSLIKNAITQLKYNPVLYYRPISGKLQRDRILNSKGAMHLFLKGVKKKEKRVRGILIQTKCFCRTVLFCSL